MNSTDYYLGNEINKVKCELPHRRVKGYEKLNLYLRWDPDKKEELFEIADFHGINYTGLIRVILEDFLKKYWNYKQIRLILDPDHF